MIMSTRLPFLFGIASIAAFTACSATTPKELNDARSAYVHATSGNAPALAPAELQTAKEALGRAEASFDSDGDVPATLNLAYVAERKAELAEVHAAVVGATNAKDQAQKTLVTTATDTAESKSDQLKKTSADLEREQAARLEAEKRMREAMARLNAIASIKEDPRGTIITIPGGVLYESGKSVLLSSAQEKLNQVADALLQDRESTMVVEGHTDSQGDDAANQTLSEQRAKSVRDYLVARGVANDRITSIGKGEGSPVADNKSPEGRANNRRVEIVVTHDKHSGK
jgi:outer membrane protein OmpA-like peptidoglycan-associated protein